MASSLTLQEERQNRHPQLERRNRRISLFKGANRVIVAAKSDLTLVLVDSIIHTTCVRHILSFGVNTWPLQDEDARRKEEGERV